MKKKVADKGNLRRIFKELAFVVVFVWIFGMMLSSGIAIAGAPPFDPHSVSGGISQCTKELDTCNADLDQSQEDLALCVADLQECRDTAAAPLLPKTGQTMSYGTNDDGALMKGVSWPNPRFTDNSNGTVTDNLTGLIWLEDASCFDPATWSDALSYVNSLGDGFCGLTDGSSAGEWRLPNVRELQSLIHYGVYPAVPNMAGTGPMSYGDPFIGLEMGSYWSSTSWGYNSTYAWYVYMFSGSVGYASKGNYYYVWPVRDDGQ